MRDRILALALIATGVPASAQVTRVLFIGNSYIYTNDLPAVFTQFALGMGDTVITSSSVAGGYTLQMHATYAPTLAAIAAQPWHFVVIQEQSQLPSFPPAQVASDVLPYAQALADTVHAHHPCAEVVYMMTWGRENGDAANCPTWPPVCTYEGMQLQLRAGYLSMAQQNSAQCAPVGMVWREVRSAAPALPLYIPDGSHPSVNGTYVAASTLYATLFRAACDANTYTAGIDSSDAALIRSLASTTVLDSISIWNIGVNDPNPGFFAFPIAPPNGEVDFEPVFTGGSHNWDFGDGSGSTDEQPLHDYSSGGLYTVTHTVTDSCGRTTSGSMQVNVVITGVPGLSGHMQAQSPLVVRWSHDQLEIVMNGALPGRFELLDRAGRRVLVKDLFGTEPRAIVPFGSDDPLLFWRYIETHSRRTAGAPIFAPR